MSITRVVAITGCDSGLGWAIAARSAREGLLAVAGMYQGVNTQAADGLRKLCAHPFPLDVKDPESVAGFRDYVKCLLKDNPNYELHAVVNNAGVMTIGNYEWMPPSIIENTINVNLLGAMRVVTAFLPDLRLAALNNPSTTKTRIINVSSHCGLQPLPSFGAYSASKAGLLAWTQALRHEHREHGLSVVAFVPGGFVTSSSLLSNQGTLSEAMLAHLNEEQRAFYQKKITTLNNYLKPASHTARFDSMRDENILETFMDALLKDDPRELYKVESWRYMFYYNLMKLPLPEWLMARVIKKFLSFPDGE